MATQRRSELLRATEAAMERLGSDPFYFAHPTRSIFQQVRRLFPIAEQRRVYDTVERHVALATRYVEERARVGVTFDGSPRRCNSTTRRGTQCVRTPLPGSKYCPSHRHLEDSADRASAA